MSLSYWIRDYIYTPLYVFFSKKKSLQKIKNINVRTKIIIYLANIVALFFMGIWHGAYWNFVIFGIYCGLLLVAYYVIADVRRQLKIKAKLTKFTSLLSVLITFYVMMFGFMMFRITNLHNLFFSLRRYLSFSFAGIAEDMTTLSQITSQHPGIFVAAILSIVIYALYFFSSNFNPKERLKDAKLIYWLAALAIMTLVIIVLLPTASGVFIYFQF
jgi:D-alanyl-lipoteichoic acid acyltransferase DltB (MBOAT superfamily)